jgi:hypothetical protein
MEIPIWQKITAVALSGLTIVGCSDSRPEIADYLNFQCTTNPDKPAKHELVLNTDQSFHLGGRTIQVADIGRIAFSSSSSTADLKNTMLDSNGTLLFRGVGDYVSQRYRIQIGVTNDTQTRVAISLNCLDLLNP